MNADVLEEQRELVASVEAAGWEVTETELSTYQSPWEDDAPEAAVTITAKKAFPEDDGSSQFRLG